MGVSIVVGRRDRIVLALILLLALLLRVDHIRQPLDDAFAWREASTAMMAENLPRNHWNPLWPEVNWTGTSPGYQGREFQTLTYGAAILNQVFGVRDWHGRVVAVLCGLITCLSLFHLVRTLRSRDEGLVAALVYAISPGAVIVDRSYLPDPAMVALCTGSLALLASGLAGKSVPRIRAAAALGIVAILAKPVAVAAVPAGLYLAFRGGSPVAPTGRGRVIVGWCLGCAVVCGLYFGWALYVGTHYPPYHVAGDWRSSLGEQVGNVFFLPRLLTIATGWLWTPVTLVLALAGLVHALLDRRREGVPFFFVAWLGGAALLYLFISRELVSNPWNLHIVDPPLAALAATGLVRTIRRIPWPGRASRAWAIALAAAVMAIIRVEAWRNEQAMKWGFNYVVDRTMGQHLRTLVADDDLVVVSGRYAGNPLAIYYSGQKGWIFPPPPGEFRLYGPSDQDGLAALRGMAAEGAKWFALANDAHDMNDEPFGRAYPHLIETLSRESNPITTRYYTIYRLTRP